MSDFFGIGPALQGCAEIMLASARLSGRTNRLVLSVKEGDRVVFKDTKSANEFKRRLRTQGIENVQCLVIPPNDPYKLRDYPTPQGKCILDHQWVEQFYLDALTHAEETIKRIQVEYGGYGEKHVETAAHFAEMSDKFRFR